MLDLVIRESLPGLLQLLARAGAGFKIGFFAASQRIQFFGEAIDRFRHPFDAFAEEILRSPKA